MAEVDARGAVSGLIQEVGNIPGKKALQKLVYLLQEGEGKGLGLSFRMYQYGPYSTELEWIVQDLQAHGLVEVEPGETFRIRSSSGAPRQTSTDQLRGVAEKFGSLRAWELELLASLHFLAKLKLYSGSDVDKEHLRRKLFAWKGTKFSRDEVDEAISRLEKEGYLPH